MSDNHNRVCPVEKAGMLQSGFRKLLHNPKKILKPFIKEGMTILDIGCGPGFFTIEAAKLVGKSGKVIAADLQEGMLDIVRNKILNEDYENRIRFHKCSQNAIGVKEKVDFVLAFFVLHELPSLENFFKEMLSILNKEGILFIVEPTFHVKKDEFNETIKIAESLGLKVIARPTIWFGRAVILSNI